MVFVASAEFKRNGLAPIRRGEDGVANLDIGRLGGTPERLVVTYERNGKVVGRAAPQEADSDDLVARVLGARNTIFAQELWHELTREARSLAAYDVRLDDDKRLICDIDSESRIIVELLPIDDCQQHSESSTADDASLPENTMAQAISITLHILLTYAHRCNELLRIRPLPPHIPRTRGQQIYTLLRPIIARLLYARSTQACTETVGALVRALRGAGISAAKFILRTPQPTVADFATAGPNQSSAAVNLVRNMLAPTDFAIELHLLPGVSLTVRGRTYLIPVTATYYHVLAPGDAAVHEICAPYGDGYPDLRALADYLHIAAAKALATHYLARLKASGDGRAWALGVQGTRIRDAQNFDAAQLDFAIQASGEETKITASRVVGVSSTLSESDAKPEAGKTWTWTSSKETSDKESLDSVVDEVLKSA